MRRDRVTIRETGTPAQGSAACGLPVSERWRPYQALAYRALLREVP